MSIYNARGVFFSLSLRAASLLDVYGGFYKYIDLLVGF